MDEPRIEPGFHVAKPADGKRIGCQCSDDCRRPAFSCEHVHWNTGNTKGLSFFYWCRKHTPTGIAAAIRFRAELVRLQGKAAHA